eukprot:TRINITY_DN27784_c0_g1_i1.p1 TRINITY_DN27784_c0_g1~~TRINITY_DN27784_c0_g1_i1.p1  ORF type:complete len:485 (+),score=74.07 TRINITY_DN27784_c0_g1_i1:31-1485(+)
MFHAPFPSLPELRQKTNSCWAHHIESRILQLEKQVETSYRSTNHSGHEVIEHSPQCRQPINHPTSPSLPSLSGSQQGRRDLNRSSSVTKLHKSEGADRRTRPGVIRTSSTDSIKPSTKTKSPRNAKRPSLGSAAHTKWAARAFRRLDVDGDERLSTCELRSGTFVEAMHDCFGGTLPETAVDALVSFAVRQAGTGSGSLSLQDFQALTWKLKRMDLVAELEADFVFSVFESTGNGLLNLQDFSQLLSFHGFDIVDTSGSKEAAKLFSEIDLDSDGVIGRSEYMHWCTTRANGFARQKRVAHFDWAAMAFSDLDLDGDGHLSACEMRSGAFLDKLRECFQATLSDDYLHPILDFVIRVASRDYGGLLSLNQFQILTWRLRRIDTDIDLEADFVFSVFDTHGKGSLNAGELQQLLDFQSSGTETVQSPLSADAILTQIATGVDGEITLAEYQRWAASSSSPHGHFNKSKVVFKRQLSKASSAEGAE